MNNSDTGNLLPRISIITVCYNSAVTITDTLNCIAGQTYPNIEYIIIDGGSTDGTLDIIKKYQKIISVLISEPDKGIYDAMNKGLEKATGDLIAFLNSDDSYMNNDILKKVAEIMSDKNIDACHADLIYVRRENNNEIVRYWRGHDHKVGDCLKGWMPAHPTFFARRSLFERYGGFNTRYRKQADFELMVRWFERYNICSRYTPEIWTKMRTGGASNNSIFGIIKGNLEAYYACRELGFKVTPFFIIRKILSRLPQYLRKPKMGK